MFSKCIASIERVAKIAELATLCKYGQKETIYGKNEEAEAFFIILLGAVTIKQIAYNEVREEEYGQVLMELGVLDYFGNIEIIYEIPRLQQAVASHTTNTQGTYCLRFSRTAYNVHLRALGFSDIELVIDQYRKLAYFRSTLLPLSDLISIALKSTVEQFPIAQLVMAPGDKSKFIYFVLSGSFQVIY